MEEYDVVVLDRQSYSRATASFSQRSDDCSDGFGAQRIIDDSHPFFEFVAHFPSAVFNGVKAGPGDAGIQF